MPKKTDAKLLAVITGASSGIGAMFARKLAARGYDLLLIARREEYLQSLALELTEAYHILAEIMVADLAVDDCREQVAERIRKAPNLGLLINNAGFGTLGFFTDMDIESQLKMHRLHILTTLHLTHAALKADGSVINVSSISAFIQMPGDISYCATKGWMNQFTAGLYAELKLQKSSLKVQALCPGYTLSEFHDTAGIDRNLIPKNRWLTADFVVSESLRGFDKGKLFVIPGWRNKWRAICVKVIPTWILRKLIARIFIKYRKQNEV